MLCFDRLSTRDSVERNRLHGLNYRELPSEKHRDSSILKPCLKLLGTGRSLTAYLLVLLEGMFIIGSFSYTGSYIAYTHHFNNLYIGLIMTGFGLMTVIGGRASGRLAGKAGACTVLTIGLISAAAADLIIYFSGKNIFLLIIGIALLGLGFIFTHSTLLTRATEFAMKSRGAAMSLVAFFFMGAGGVGTALGGRIIAEYGLEQLFAYYGFALMGTLAMSFLLIRDSIVDEDESREEVAGIY